MLNLSKKKKSVIHKEMADQYNQYAGYNGEIRENYGSNGCNTCPMSADTPPVQETGTMMTSCPRCTSIYMVLKNRSPYDRMYLRSYNRLPSHYQTNLDSLVFAP